MNVDRKFIYTVSHPVTEEVVYVGCTQDIETRAAAHCAKNQTSDLSKWIQCLFEDGLLPVFTIVDSMIYMDGGYLAHFELEDKYILFYHNKGCKLFNKRIPGVRKDKKPQLYTLVNSTEIII